MFSIASTGVSVTGIETTGVSVSVVVVTVVSTTVGSVVVVLVSSSIVAVGFEDVSLTELLLAPPPHAVKISSLTKSSTILMYSSFTHPIFSMLISVIAYYVNNVQEMRKLHCLRVEAL